ncbi:MAG: TIGR01777 family oxidoreductase [Bacteroidales bacterium]|nr:TIGR01777 family oxidoreductase [Bacteroidales bacterium]
MIVAVSGSSGFIGKALLNKMKDMDWTVRAIERAAFALPDQEFRSSLIEGADVVINLAGAPISKKWTPEYKAEIRESRVKTTSKIVKAILEAGKKPSVFISASAIGIYDSIQTHTESSCHYSSSFLSQVCQEWEAEALKAEPATRVVLIRTGLVLGEKGGALKKLSLPFRIGLGGKISAGEQAISFIHLFDLVNAYLFILENPSVSGVVNAVSPMPTTNKEFTDTFGKVLDQPAWLRVPAFALKRIYGERAQVFLEGQRVLPEKLEQAGFQFRYPTIRSALIRIYKL